MLGPLLPLGERLFTVYPILVGAARGCRRLFPEILAQPGKRLSRAVRTDIAGAGTIAGGVLILPVEFFDMVTGDDQEDGIAGRCNKEAAVFPRRLTPNEYK